MGLGDAVLHPLSLARHPHIAPAAGPLLLVVLDGVGEAPADPYNAVSLAKMPCLEALRVAPDRFVTVAAHGTAVGMPTDADLGNSEVGHNALGAGRVVAQGATLVDEAIASGTLAGGDAFDALVAACRAGGTLHMVGLLSDGGVHSRLDQLLAMLDAAVLAGVTRVRLHVLLDGRDVPDQTAEHYVEALEEALRAHRAAGVDARIASGGGRMGVTMDRYEADWSIVERGYEAHVNGNARPFATAAEALAALRADEPGVSDQYLPAFAIHDETGPIGAMQDGDAVLCFNFRGDRVIEFSQAMEDADFSGFTRSRWPNVVYAGLLEYDGDRHIPRRFLVDPPAISNPAGAWFAQSGVRTLALSETQKYGHVTYFWNGNRSATFDDTLEAWQELPSDTVPFDQAPEMQAMAIAEAVERAVASGAYDFIRVNIANGDMVGHTGALDATVLALETTDRALARMLAAVDAAGGRYLVTADHGNADDMAIRDKTGAPKKDASGAVVPRTSHTLAPVPVCIGGAGLPAHVGLRAVEGAGLANLTATYTALLGFAAPSTWRPSLLRFDRDA